MFDDIIGKLKLVLSLVEESVLRTLYINEKFDYELFYKIIKKITYENLENDIRQENVDFLISNLRLNYDFGNINEENSVENLLKEFNNLNHVETLHKIELLQLNKIDVGFMINDDLSIDFEIPIKQIIKNIRKIYNKEKISTIELNKDLNLIDQIWDDWYSDEFNLDIKNIVNDIIENLNSE